MRLIDLCGGCTMRQAPDGKMMESRIPGSVAETLLEQKKIPDPYDGDNEKKVLPVFEGDYIFRKTFTVCEEDLDHDRICLTCEGLDTICDITVNGEFLGSADNMFVKHQFDVKERLKIGENVVEFYFHSPVRYLEEHRIELGKPFNAIRKAACMFGWDWGINLPDSGVWKPCYIEAFDAGKILRADIRQEHRGDQVRLRVNVLGELWDAGMTTAGTVTAELADPDGNLLSAQEKPAASRTAFSFEITDPALWWPRGYGKQPLYSLKISLMRDGRVLDLNEKHIGLRKVALNRQKDGGGHKYEFVVNGCPVYIKGESLVIQDAILPRSTEERWRRMLRDCASSNLNCIRVWGGAYYPPDIFYELCDREGILVFQDFMFACTFYYPSKAFMENVGKEVRQQVIRLRDHPCICVFCGNNELDCIYTTMTSAEPETSALRRLFGAGNPFDWKTRLFIRHIYGKLFLKLIPKLCGELAPEIPYTHSSPSGYRPLKAKSFFDYLDDGDMHYYLQYNGNAPYQRMRTLKCRFMSELGFQSYPSCKTIESFTKPEDRAPYTDVMYAHQKCRDGNETIEEYLRREYTVPEDFEDYVYLSQLQAGEIMGYSVEHMRRHNDYNRGIILWQLNDCWPVCSWSGIDYYGRWKAQQYYTRRFFEPILVSAEDDGLKADIYVICDGAASYEGGVRWSLETDGEVLASGREALRVEANGRKLAASLDFADYGSKRREMYLRYALEGYEDSVRTLIFCPHREFSFGKEAPRVQVTETETSFCIDLSSEKLVKGLMLDLREKDAVFSDNFFDLKGTRRITVEKKDCDAKNLEEFSGNLFVKSLNEVMGKNNNEVSDS